MQTNKSQRVLAIVVALVTMFSILFVPGASTKAAGNSQGREFWQHIPGTPPPARANAKVQVNPGRFNGNRLNRGGMAALLATAPREKVKNVKSNSLILSLPNPQGNFEDFMIQESPIMEPGLAAKHPEIKTYKGIGIDDPTASIRFDLTPLGFHASIRSAHGAWYVEPYYQLDDSFYVSYFGRDLQENPHGSFVEGVLAEPEVSVTRGFYHAVDDVELLGLGFPAGASLTIRIWSSEETFAAREISAIADQDGTFSASFVADPDGMLESHEVTVTDGNVSATTTYQVISDEDVSVDPPVGDQLRTYRLALVSDWNYANYFGGPTNVTAAKVTLINRVTQVYEDETSIRLVLVNDNDLLNFDTQASMIGTNGPCGGSACYTAAQAGSCGSGTLTRNRIVVGLLIGASNYDIGHIGLGVNGGGVASLGVVGGNSKAQGCTGLPAPVGDFFAVDYVAHEMGHQFAGNHTFNGTQSNCSGGNRNAGTSVEPGSGSSIMAYAGICLTDNLQPHSDPYWSQRSFDEIVTYTSAAETNISEVQMGVLTGFSVNGQLFQLQYNSSNSAAIVRGTNFTTAGIQAAIQGIPGWPAGGTATVSALTDTGFTITFGGSALANTNVSELQLVNCSGGCTGYVGEIAKGGVTTRRGTVTPTGNNFPQVTAPSTVTPFLTIPVRTPFELTASGSDPDGDIVTFMWEQNDRGAAAGTGLITQPKTNGPLFRQFGVAATVSSSDTLLYHSPGENFVTTNPSRVFPDMAQIIVNNTNAESGSCPAGNVDCFSEFLPTSAYVGFTGVNASPLSFHFRATVRDGRGGVNTVQTTLLLATGAGPFLVTSPNTGVAYKGGSNQTITWNPANTNIAPVSASNVKISLSTDGGYTYPYVLAASTANDGSELLSLPNVGTTQARVKIEAVGNVFFDISNADFTIQAAPVVNNSLGVGGSQSVQYSDSLSPDLIVSATDADSLGKDLSVVAVGLPAGLSLSIISTSNDSTLPGIHTWKVAGVTTAAPGSYPVTVTVTDDTGGIGATSFTIVVTKENAEATYTGDMLAFTASGGSTANVLLRTTVQDSSVVPAIGDTQPGDIRNATVTFKEGATSLCGPLPVALINGATTTGIATCTTSLGLGAHTIDVYINNYYIGATQAVVEVAQPNGSFITGGGFLTIGQSGGTYPADTGSKMNLGFNVNYKNTKSLQGHANIIFRAGGHTYQIKSTAIDSLGIALKNSNGNGVCSGPPSLTCFGIADFRSKANLTDVTNPLAPVSLGGNLTLQITITDKGEPGSSDTIGVTLWDGNKLVFSSEWKGSKTLEQILGGGNLVVH